MHRSTRARKRPIEYRGRHGKQARARIGIRRRAFQRFPINPDGFPGDNPYVDASRILIRKVDLTKLVDALLEKPSVVLGRQDALVAVKQLRSGGIDVYPPVSLDIERALDVQHVQGVVPTERDRARTLPEPHAVVEKFEVHAFVGTLYPGKKKLRHSRVRYDAVRESVVDGLIAAELESAVPGALHQRRRRCDHEKEIDDLTKSGQQIAARLVRIGGEAIETKPIDQQVRHVSAPRFSRHIAIEFLIDYLELLSGERGRVPEDRAKTVVVDQLFAPDVRTDQRKLAPGDPDVAGERLLQRTQGALARGRRSFCIHDHRLFLSRQQAVPFDPGRMYNQWIDKQHDLVADKMVASHVGNERRDKLAA